VAKIEFIPKNVDRPFATNLFGVFAYFHIVDGLNFLCGWEKG